jgi:hypothetical protein
MILLALKCVVRDLFFERDYIDSTSGNFACLAVCRIGIVF